MEFKFQTLDKNSQYLEQVIELADKNSKTLGFFRRGAFLAQAEKGWIIICLCLTEEETKLAGYLMYRTKRNQQVSITHFCISSEYRNQNLARPLLNFLKEKTQRYYGVSLYCRRDYNLDGFWRKLGFSPRAEKEGRGIDKEPLTYWYLNYGHLDLLDLLAQKSVNQKHLIVVLDSNIFYDFYLGNSDEGSLESQSLKADWLRDEQELFLTQEIYVEIDRNNDTKERRQWKKRVSDFQLLPTDMSKHNAVYSEMRNLFPINMTDNDQSDLEHLTLSIIGDAGFFITRDEGIISLAGKVKEKFDLQIMHPSTYIIHLDELYNSASYNTERLSGTSIGRERVTSSKKDDLIRTFLNTSEGEKISHFRTHVNQILSNPKDISFYIISQGENPLFCIAYKRVSKHILEIPIFRMCRSGLSKTLVKHLILETIQSSVYSFKKYLTLITDEYASTDIKEALNLDMFEEIGGNYARLTFSYIGSLKNLYSLLERVKKENAGQITNVFLSEQLSNLLRLKPEEITDDTQVVSEIEKTLYPAKILGSKIPNYIVPIKPEWAKRLFDANLANQELFNVDPILALRREVVYYCTARNIGEIQNLKGIGRILWYVSQGSHYGVQSIRACSRLDEVVVDTPENLYRQFSRLGIYQLSDIKNIPNPSDPSRKVMALKFSDTELFQDIVSFDRIKEILESTASLQSIRRIDDNAFRSIYCEGFAIKFRSQS